MIPSLEVARKRLMAAKANYARVQGDLGRAIDELEVASKQFQAEVEKHTIGDKK